MVKHTKLWTELEDEEPSDFKKGQNGKLLVALDPGSPFRICLVALEKNFSPKLRDKIRNGEPGFEARLLVLLGYRRS